MRAVAAALVLLTGCASSSSDPAPACHIEGTWALHYNRDSQSPGNCTGLPDAQDEVVTLRLASPTSVTMEFQGAAGGCLGTLDGCALTNKCDYGTTSATVSTRQDAWRFTSTGMGGSSFFGYKPPSGGSCSYNTVVSGKLK